MTKRHNIRLDDQREDLIRRYEEGETMTSLVNTLGVSRPTLYRCFREWGVLTRGRVSFDQTITIPSVPTALAYIAGILDGEGTITILRPERTRQRQHHVTIQIGSTTRELHDWLLATVGGTVHERHIRHLGKLPIWYWYITRIRDVRAFLTALLPYLIIKRDRAVEALLVVNRRL